MVATPRLRTTAPESILQKVKENFGKDLDKNSPSILIPLSLHVRAVRLSHMQAIGDHGSVQLKQQYSFPSTPTTGSVFGLSPRK